MADRKAAGTKLPAHRIERLGYAEPTWRYKLVKLAQRFVWGDHEYLRKEWRWRFPWVFWLTIYEPSYRRGWRKILPWRIRTAWADVVTDLLVRRCPGCRRRFTCAELTNRDGHQQLIRYMSGTTWHKGCLTSDIVLRPTEADRG